MFMNRPMIPVWQAYLKSPNVQLPKELQRTLSSSFIEMYECTLLDSMIPDMWRPVAPDKNRWDDMPLDLKCFGLDKTNIERIVSKIHIDDCPSNVGKPGARRDLRYFQYAMIFLKGVFQLFLEQYPSQTLRGIISINDGCEPNYCFSCCVFYHVKRDGESWLSEDYDQGDSQDKLFVMDSDELLLSMEAQ